MRSVRSRNFFEQMKGRGVRVINPTDFQAVTPDDTAKTHFVIVDCVGVTEQELVDTRPLEKQPGVAFDKLLDAVAFGSTDPDLLSSLASRLARLDKQLDPAERTTLQETAHGIPLKEIVSALVEALDPDRQVEAARVAAGLPPDADPSPQQVAVAAKTLLKTAGAPLASNPDLRQRLKLVRQQLDQTIDTLSQDTLLEASHSPEARERARETVQSFEQFVEHNRDEITALQVLYSRPYAQRLRYADVKALAAAIKAPPRSWTPEGLWQAYEALDRSRVRGSGGRVLTDVVALVRYALHQDDALVPFPAQVQARFEQWLAQQASLGRSFTPEQRQWLALIRDHVAANLGIDTEDFEYAPFVEHGGLGRVYQVFGADLAPLLEELNEVFAA
jgi:type I restriction enzyme R subunit